MTTIVELQIGYIVGDVQSHLTAFGSRGRFACNVAYQFRTAATHLRLSIAGAVRPPAASILSSVSRNPLERARCIVETVSLLVGSALAESKVGSSLDTVSRLPAWMLLLALGLLLSASTQAAAAPGSISVDKICSLIESSAHTNSLPIDFLTRLIWQESRFKPDVIGASTKDGGRAEGIAQFMPTTAAEHKLIEPFDPVEALPKSAEFLAQLRDQFGNLGLAAAAYNAGPKRVQDYLAGTRALPMETRKYVLTITGKPVQAWVQPSTQQQNSPNAIDANPEPPNPNCQDLVARLEQQDSRAPDLAKSGAVQTNRNVPGWCSGLRHPNVSACGDVHMPLSPAKSSAVPGPSIRMRLPRRRLHLTMAIVPLNSSRPQK
jgi:soluble lytic murein transglycosylase-like protein